MYMEGAYNILPKDGDVYFFPQLFPVEESDVYFNALQQEIAWRQEPITIYGCTVMQPRLTAWYGDPDKVYSYSGITMQPHAWTATLLKIKQRIETVSPVIFNSALLNLYRDQHDSMGWHRDNEKELGINPVIGSVSFGATRIFQFRYYTDKRLKQSLELTHGSFLLMQGKTQHAWEHSLPKRAGIMGTRINITFRVVK
jgi:alkylated DNA repair dioxygenase AlkB